MPELSDLYKAGDIVDGKRVAWVPQPRQAEFMRRFEDEALFGGAAGGGKSDALVAEALRQIDKPLYKGLIIRKTVPQLMELIDKSLRLYPQIDPHARFNQSKNVWTFSNGSKVLFGSLHTPKEKIKYQGQAYDFIGFDELTHFTWEEYEYLMSRNRPNGPDMLCYIRGTANPGGVGHGWVKDRFITPAPPMTTIWDEVKFTERDGSTRKRRMSRIFIPSFVQDNPALMRNDPNYVFRLASMSEAKKKALLYGDWDSYEGQVFREWRNDPDHYMDRRYTHVITPFDIPSYWRIYRSFDWGYSKPFSVGWWAVDPEGIAYRVKEWYGCKPNDPNTGIEMDMSDVAFEIKKTEQNDPLFRGKRINGIADPAIWNRETGQSIAEIAERVGVYFDKADNTRLAGLAQFHERLKFGSDGRPRMYVFNTCREFIRTIPSLVYDEKKVEDVNTEGEDHIYDESRYFCMANIVAPRITVPTDRWHENPMYMYLDVKKGDLRNRNG